MEHPKLVGKITAKLLKVVGKSAAETHNSRSFSHLMWSPRFCCSSGYSLMLFISQHFEDFAKTTYLNFEEIEKNRINNFEETRILTISAPLEVIEKNLS